MIQKGLDRLMVLYWYQSHGRVIASEYTSKMYMVYDAMRLNRTDGALVRVTTPTDRGGTSAMRTRPHSAPPRSFRACSRR